MQAYIKLTFIAPTSILHVAPVNPICIVYVWSVHLPGMLSVAQEG